MSTKIYYGHKIPFTKAKDILGWCLNKKKLVLAERNNQIKRFFDMKKYHEDYFDIKSKFDTAVKSPYRGEPYDFEATAMFFPLDDYTLFIPFCQNRAMQKVICDGAQFYGYWDNVDRDETCSEDEWKQRKIDWDVVLPGFVAPIDVGFCFTFSNGQAPYPFELWPELLDSSKQEGEL